MSTLSSITIEDCNQKLTHLVLFFLLKVLKYLSQSCFLFLFIQSLMMDLQNSCLALLGPSLFLIKVFLIIIYKQIEILTYYLHFFHGIILGNTYNIPIAIWLLETHPLNAPLVFVRPTSGMQIRISKHVDHNGKVYLPYLHIWSPVSLNLFRNFITKFVLGIRKIILFLCFCRMNQTSWDQFK